MSQSPTSNHAEPDGVPYAGSPLRSPSQPPAATPSATGGASPVTAAPGPTARKKSAFFAKIATREDALEVARSAALFFFFVAALQIIVGIVFVAMGSSDPAQQVVGTGIDVAAFAGGGLALLKLNSRVAAVGLLCYSILSFVIPLGANGHISYISVAAVIIAIRATIATFKLHGTLA